MASVVLYRAGLTVAILLLVVTVVAYLTGAFSAASAMTAMGCAIAVFSLSVLYHARRSAAGEE